MTPEENNKNGDALKKVSKAVLSSEKREDIWAIILAIVIMLCSIAVPDLVHDLFSKGLFFF